MFFFIFVLKREKKTTFDAIEANTSIDRFLNIHLKKKQELMSSDNGSHYINRSSLSSKSM